MFPSAPFLKLLFINSIPIFPPNGKNGFPGAIIGMSGGIDSALTLCVAVDALGADKVRAVMMPSPYTAEISLAAHLGETPPAPLKPQDYYLS